MTFTYSIDKNRLSKRDRRNFSNKNYTCVNLYADDKNRPVTIMKCKNTVPMPYMVQYGFSSVYFRTYEEAEAFCAGRFSRVEE